MSVSGKIEEIRNCRDKDSKENFVWIGIMVKPKDALELKFGQVEIINTEDVANE